MDGRHLPVHGCRVGGGYMKFFQQPLVIPDLEAPLFHRGKTSYHSL